MTAPIALQSEWLAALPGVRHGFFTRAGGVSSGIYESLNTGLGSKDDSVLVRENRRRVAAALAQTPEALCVCDQVHSAQVVVARTGFGADSPRADGVVAGADGLICAVLTADCAPVLLADTEARVVGAAHAGWRGAVCGIVEAAVDAMIGLGARREAITAAIGPCIAPQSYEVGEEFLARFEAEHAEAGRFFSPGQAADKFQFDLPDYVLWRLVEAGVSRAHWIGEDTFARPDRYFSNRRAFKSGEADYGRLISAIALTP